MQDTSTSRRAPPFRYRDPLGAVEWLRTAFGIEPRFIAKRSDGSFTYAQLLLGTHEITVTARDERSLAPAAPDTSGYSLAVPDIAAHFVRAKAAGAEIVRDLEAEDGGSRSYVCRDIEGNLWSFKDMSSQAPRMGTVLAWARAHMPRVDRVAAQRTGIAAAAALTLVALAVPEWRHFSEPAVVAPLKIGEGRALEHARFALAEEQAARLVAETSRRAALDDLAQERSARRDAERAARRLETDLAAARETRAAAERLVKELEQRTEWETRIAPAAATSEAPVKPSAELIPVSAVATPASSSANPALAEGEAALARGDMAEARRLFRRLADAGMADAALALGSTYDPVNATRTGADVDRAQAKQWYRRAIELAQAATEREPAP